MKVIKIMRRNVMAIFIFISGRQLFSRSDKFADLLALTSIGMLRAKAMVMKEVMVMKYVVVPVISTEKEDEEFGITMLIMMLNTTLRIQSMPEHCAALEQVIALDCSHLQ